MLFTDLYQLVMAQLYLADGLADRTAHFDYFYRSNPDYGSHQAGFGVFAGLEVLLDWMGSVRVSNAELAALAAQRGPTGEPRFSSEFLDWLAENGHFSSLEVRAVGEGRVIHPHIPVISVTGPLAVAQMLETALLNICNYPTLIATKAARIVQSARGGDVLEFGMRRGPAAGVDEAIRAALIGGCVSTSNVQAAVAAGRDPKGTHAHSMVQAYLALGQGELGAFRAFARQYPDECILLVDTIDTLRSGVPNAITVFNELRQNGHTPLGIRLDSGDLAHLAVRSAALLDEAGFEDVRIVLSGDLDELTIWQILTQISEEAPGEGLDAEAIRRRLIYGVGTRLITSEGDSSLGGVYKLTAIHDEAKTWVPAVKLSESRAKIPIVGPNRCWRIYDKSGLATVDLLMLPEEEPFHTGDVMTVHHPANEGVFRRIGRGETSRVELLADTVLRQGVRSADPVSVDVLSQRRASDVAKLDPGVRRLVNPHVYHVSLSDGLRRRQDETIRNLRTGI
ncbi:MAG TPA: nicotinate phosphoribosyltransferase [Microthrixaceae bacterium]|nr:nicotinate phosphoribosyltransferase [Microthrixaceae bacterium]